MINPIATLLRDFALIFVPMMMIVPMIVHLYVTATVVVALNVQETNIALESTGEVLSSRTLFVPLLHGLA
jgi:hypothetical protein